MLDYLLINKIIVTLIICMAVWLGFWVYSADKKSKANKIFFLLVISNAYWISLYYLVMASVGDTGMAIFWAKLGLGTVSLFLIPFYLFFVYFFGLERKLKLFNYAVIVDGLVFFFLSVFSDYVVKGVEFKEVGVDIILGTGALGIYLMSVVLSVFIIILLVKKYISSAVSEKVRIQYFLIGVLIWVTMNFIFNMLPGIFQGRNTPLSLLGHYSFIILSLFTAWAIAKRKLFGMRVVFAELLVALIGLLLLINFLVSENTLEYIWKGALLGAFIVFGFLLIKSVQKEIEQKEEMDKMATKLATAHIKLEGAYEQLKSLDEAKSEFISIASHQLRTPLTAIKGYVSMILEGDYGKLAAKTLKPIENIYASSERLIALVNSLLNISRLESGKMTIDYSDVNVADLTADVVKELNIHAEQKSLKLVVEVEPSFPATIRADKDKLRNIVLNLIDNAIKYTAKGGITVFLQAVENTKVRIVVQDTGVGLETEEIARLFESFSRAGAGQRVWVEGAGLGLYIARKFVEMHQGKVWVESEGRDKGSRFIAELPIQQPPLAV